MSVINKEDLRNPNLFQSSSGCELGSVVLVVLE